MACVRAAISRCSTKCASTQPAAQGTQIADVVVVPSSPKQSAQKIVGVACADVDIRARVAAQVDQAGASLVWSDPEMLARTACQFDIVIVFADGLRAGPLLRALQSLEAMQDAPSVIVVSDKSRALWTTSDRFLAVTLAAWTTNAIEWIRSSSSTVPREYSGPELPFTD